MVKGALDVPEFNAIEEYRRSMLMDDRIISRTDYGTRGGDTIPISRIASRSLTSPGFSRFLYRTNHFVGAKNILELGTSLGINALYLAMSMEAQVTTIEGCPQTADLAQDLFERSGKRNIRLIIGHIEIELPKVVSEGTTFNLVFIDANHRYDATLNYFRLCQQITSENAILVIHDIHSSLEMERAWKKIRFELVAAQTLDLFECGIILFRPDFSRQDLRLFF